MQTHSTGHTFNDILFLVEFHTCMVPFPPSPIIMYACIYILALIQPHTHTHCFRNRQTRARHLSTTLYTSGWFICLKNLPCQSALNALLDVYMALKTHAETGDFQKCPVIFYNIDIKLGLVLQNYTVPCFIVQPPCPSTCAMCTIPSKHWVL